MRNEMPVNNVKNWRVEDPFPESCLEDIQPISSRAMSLVARKKETQILSEAFLQIYGAVEMMQGMEYHHDRFMDVILALRSLVPLSNEARRAEAVLNHEAVAYVNRLGQFYYFTQSKVVKDRQPDVKKLVPKISELKIFRMKYSAHRSIDEPRAEDTPHLQTVHAMAFSTLVGGLFHPKEPCFSGDTRVRYDKYYRVFQLNMGAEGCWDLIIERDHPVCMEEAYALLETLLK